VKIFFDGGCRPNPGTMEAAVVAGGRTYYRDDLGEGDCNDAEWQALLLALRVARTLELSRVTLLGDSAFVVDQVNRPSGRSTDRFTLVRAEFRALAAGFAQVRVRKIGRAQNLAGIALERIHGKL